MADLAVGVYICNCGTNIAKVVNCEQLQQCAEKLPNVTVARSYKYMCSNPGQELITKDIKEHGLTRVVVGACSPRMHERTFRTALVAAGLNPYFLEMANIREQCSWVHTDSDEATAKAEALTRAAVARVAYHEPLETMSAAMCPASLVIGGGIAGMTAALEIAGAGHPVFLVERSLKLGGNVARLDLTAPHFDSARDIITETVTRVEENDNIRVLLGAKVTKLDGFIGNFKATFETTNGDRPETTVDVGSVVVATGYNEFDAARVTQFGYGRHPNVVTSFEFEKMLKAGRIETKEGRVPRYIAIIHCVGSRSQEFHGYCSRVCCTTGLKHAQEAKSAIPGCFVSNLYIDMEAFGKGCEAFYRRASETNTAFLMYGKNDLPVIKRADPVNDGCQMLIAVNEKLSGESIEIPADLVILMVGMEAQADADKVARLVNISQDKDGWFIESHPKLDPVATTTEGIFIAGACSGPKDIPDSVAQARAAVARILAKIGKGKIDIEAVYAEIDEEHCCGCRMCNGLCPYSAVVFDEVKHRSSVISAMCKACGACVASCPSGAIKGRHFTDQQIFAEIEGILA
jgi:heterodisulfide reductase subunit A